jgi:hypothetical protein
MPHLVYIVIDKHKDCTLHIMDYIDTIPFLFEMYI